MIPAVTESTPHWVYIFRGAEGVVLYVGCTGNLPKRIREHALDKPWWPEVAHIETSLHPNRTAGRAAEDRLIRLLRPTHERSAANHSPLVDNAPRVPCRTCQRGRHAECVGVNKNDQRCTCGVCRAARIAA